MLPSGIRWAEHSKHNKNNGQRHQCRYQQAGNYPVPLTIFCDHCVTYLTQQKTFTALILMPLQHRFDALIIVGKIMPRAIKLSYIVT